MLGPNSFTFDVTTANVGTTADPTATVADSLVNEGAAGGGKFWDITGGATVTGNWVHGNGYAGLWPDTDNAGFNISGNYIDHNWAEGIIYEASYNGAITGNTFVDNAWGGGPSPALGGFPDAALYLSESGSDPRVPGAYGSAFNVTNNVFTDNWGGVVIYENSNRACGVSNDALCTLVAPGTYTLASCAAHIPGGLSELHPRLRGQLPVEVGEHHRGRQHLQLHRREHRVGLHHGQHLWLQRPLQRGRDHTVGHAHRAVAPGCQVSLCRRRRPRRHLEPPARQIQRQPVLLERGGAVAIRGLLPGEHDDRVTVDRGGRSRRPFPRPLRRAGRRKLLHIRPVSWLAATPARPAAVVPPTPGSRSTR